tara:strand:- start:961 stop:3972 length:3012 start_codon:yes stop_codon:yes gene_type:complete
MALNSKVAIDVQIKNVQKITDLKNSLKALRKEQRDIEKATKDGNKSQNVSSKRYKDNAKAIDTNSKSLRNLNRNQKDATKSSNGMAKSFVKGAAAIGIIVGAFRAVNRVISSVITTFTEFEFQMAKVKAISGATDKEFKELSQTAQDLGRTTFFTAQQVAELQTNYAKLGFTTSEILNAQEATLLLATATGSDLARAAVVAGAAVRGFGLHASETTRVVDVMTLAFNSSALDIEKWQTSMTKVAPIAAGMNIEIEDTAAIMGTLTDAGIEASIAGTSMRNIFLKMKDSSSDLSKFLGFTVRSSDDLEKALVKLNTASSDTLDGLVNIRQVAAFNVMVKGSERVKKLTEELREAEGAAKKAASIIGDTLEGAFLRLTSASQGLSIELVDKLGGGLQDFTDKVALALNRMTENSEQIAKMITLLVSAVKWIGLYKLGTIAYTTAIRIATTATALFNRSLVITRARMMKTGVGVLVVGLGVLAEKFLFAGDKAGDASREMDKYRGEIEKTTEAQDKLNKALGEGLPTSLEEVQPALDRQNQYITKIQDKQLAGHLAFQKRWGHITAESYMKEDKATQDLYHEEAMIFKEQKKELIRLIDEFEQKKTRITGREGELRKDKLEKLFKEAKDSEDIRYRQSILAEQNKYLKSETTKEQFDDNMLQKEITHFEKMKIILSSYSEDVSAIENKILDLRIKAQDKINKGLEKTTKAREEFDSSFISSASDEYWNALVGDVLNGTSTIKNAEQDLADFQIELIDNVLQDEMLSYEQRVKLETQLTKLKLDNAEKEKVARQVQIDGVAALGSQLINLAGEDEKMQAIKKVGIQLSAAAAIANNLEALSLAAKGVARQSTLIFPYNLIAMATTLATVFSLIANIKALKNSFGEGGVIEEFAEGGMVHGPSHAQGGVKFAVGGRVNELEGGEAVINKRSTAMFRNQLSSMNQAGGGVKFADGGLMSSPAFTEAQFNAQNQGQMMGAMQGRNKVVVVEADITDSQSSVSVIQANAAF